MRLIDADAFDKCLEGAEIEATKNRKYVLSSAINTIRGNLANFPNVNQWIPVSERLPDSGKPVLISALMPLCTMVYIGYLSDGVWFCDRLFFRSDEVVAWMPLPDAYEVDD